MSFLKPTTLSSWKTWLTAGWVVTSHFLEAFHTQQKRDILGKQWLPVSAFFSTLHDYGCFAHVLWCTLLLHIRSLSTPGDLQQGKCCFFFFFLRCLTYMLMFSCEAADAVVCFWRLLAANFSLCASAAAVDCWQLMYGTWACYSFGCWLAHSWWCLCWSSVEIEDMMNWVWWLLVTVFNVIGFAY